MIVFLLCLIIAIMLFGSSKVLGAFGKVLGFIFLVVGLGFLSKVTGFEVSDILLGIFLAILGFAALLWLYETSFGNPEAQLRRKQKKERAIWQDQIIKNDRARKLEQNDNFK